GTGATGNNGLSSPTILDFDNDGDADYVYAGDLNGNLWKFDLTANTPTSWSVQSIFTAEDPSGNPQPITGQPTVAYNTLIGSPNYGKLYVFFGTGSFIFDTDPSDTQVQSWYALIDDGSPISGRSDLKQRAISNTGTLAGKDVRTFQVASSGDMAGMKGWYLDFPAGERMVTGSVLHKLIVPTLIGSSIVPDDDPCAPGGSGYVNLIDPFTGGSLTEIIIDIDNDDDFDNQDKLGNEIVGSVDPDIGMPGAPIVVGNRLVVGGSSGGMTSFNVNLGAVTTGRLMWREIIILD
ncbi:MAG TPA: pilus assembly protein, partial [Chromatiales bacterium]|nr:pilus assembly protein [Chromatiales bacterium]